VRRLIIRPGAIGDLIASLPALEHLRTDYTEVWVGGANGPLVRFADRVCSIAGMRLDLLELGLAPDGLMDHLAAFDSIVSWYGAARPEFRAATGELPIDFHAALPGDVGVQATDFYLAQVGAGPGARPRIMIPAVPSEGFVAIHPFSGSARKNWPLEKFQALGERLSDVRWVAGPGEVLDGAVRFDNLYELACWLKRARLFIGNDSGIMHLAAAVGIPVMALFGHTEPAVWAPRGAHVLRHQPLAELSVDEVARLAAAIGT
jgi:heptosyltransferase III